MTNAAYVAAFDIASVALLHRIGIDPDYRAREGCSTFALELHTIFHRELAAGDPYLVETRVLGADRSAFTSIIRSSTRRSNLPPPLWKS